MKTTNDETAAAAVVAVEAEDEITTPDANTLRRKRAAALTLSWAQVAELSLEI
jgi:ribosome biogenesis protein Tsr3